MPNQLITGVILTFNEADQLHECIKSLRSLTSEILVLDSGSTDGTLELVRKEGFRCEFRHFDNFASQRNAALGLVNTEWTLFLDADERLRAPQVSEMLDAVCSAPNMVAAYWIPRRNLVFGRFLRGGGWWPDYQLRLLRTKRVRYDPDRHVHETVEFDGISLRLRQAMIHCSYQSRREFIRRQRRYTEMRVRQEIDAGVLPRRRTYLASPAREFWRRYVRLAGYRDHADGLFLAAVLALEELRTCWLLRHSELTT